MKPVLVFVPRRMVRGFNPETPCLWCPSTAPRPECEYCEGLGAVFNTVVLRGLAAVEGVRMLIEGFPPVWLDVEVAPGVVASFERAVEKIPPYWFIKEDGIQVYQHGTEARDRAARSARICELGFHQARLLRRSLWLHERALCKSTPPARVEKARRLIAKIDAAVSRVQERMDALERQNVPLGSI